MNRSHSSDFELDGGWQPTGNEEASFTADVTARYSRTVKTTLEDEFDGIEDHHDEVSGSEHAEVESSYSEQFTSHYQSDTQTSFTDGVVSQVSGSSGWGKDASGERRSDITVNTVYSEDSGWGTETFDYEGHVTGSSKYQEDWTQPIGGALSGGVTVDMGEYEWDYESTTDYNGSTTHDADSDSSPPGMLNTLNELEFEIGYDPSELTDLQSDLPYASLSGFHAGSWSPGPSGAEDTIPYTPPPGSQPEEPVVETWDEPPGGYENVYWEATKGFLHGFFVTGTKAIVNSGADAIGGLVTLGQWDPPDVIPVDPNTDLGYEQSAIAARVGVEAGLTALTMGASCTSRVGTAMNALDTAGAVVMTGQGVGDIAENGLTAQNAFQVVAGAVGSMGVLRHNECFPAGTPISTESGLRSIEQIETGERVWAYDLLSGEWKLRPVLETYAFESRTFVEIESAGETLVSTAHHPFWVIRGEQLENRPRPEHIATAEDDLLRARVALAGREQLVGAAISEGLQEWSKPLPAGPQLPGRWVDAADLREGDVLFLRSGRETTVKTVRMFADDQPTYNFAVADFHCYAVGRAGVLVHNNYCVGGRYGDVRKANSGGQVHHIPADSISPYSRVDGPSVWMETADHMRTQSWGSSRLARAYRARQAVLVAQGNIREAMQMDIDDIRRLFGTQYDDAIAQMLEYASSLE